MDVVEEIGNIDLREKEDPDRASVAISHQDRGDFPGEEFNTESESTEQNEELEEFKKLEQKLCLANQNQPTSTSVQEEDVIICKRKSGSPVTDRRSRSNHSLSLEDKQTSTEAHFLRPQILTPPRDMDSPTKPEVETQTKACCSNDGHICFDCFPIPDELLQQLHLQTGMTKLGCLQAVQTVIKFYKHDLISSKYYAYEATGIGEHTQHSQSGFNDSSLIFATHLSPRFVSPALSKESESKEKNVQSEKLQKRHQIQTETKREADVVVEELYRERDPSRPSFDARMYDYDAPPLKPTMMLCDADKFRNLINRLKNEPAKFWSDPQNASFVFTFFRKINKVAVALDRSLLKKLIMEDDFKFVWVLANFLRRETRWSIQWEILGLIGTLATRDSRTKGKLFDSDFPVYLSRGILDPKFDSPKVGAYAELLTVLFTGGKPLPVFLTEHLGLNFISAVLDILENDDSRPGWALPDVLTKLILSYNLQFNSDDVYNNITILAIARMGICRALTSRCLDWLEQKDCPLTCSWEVSISVHQCVVKMVTDIFLCRKTSQVFSVSEAVQLIQLLVNLLGNYLAGDRRRTSYLKLIQTILYHCKYDYVRNSPSLQKLEDILLETGLLSLRDQDVIRKIFKDFPRLKQESYSFHFVPSYSSNHA